MKTVIQESGDGVTVILSLILRNDAGIGLFMILGPTMVMSYWYCQQLMNHASVIRESSEHFM